MDGEPAGTGRQEGAGPGGSRSPGRQGGPVELLRALLCKVLQALQAQLCTPEQPRDGLDGEILFFAYTTDGTEPTAQEDIFGVDSATASERRLTDESSGTPFISDRDPSWSPDRTQIAHARNDDLVISTAAGATVATHPVPARQPVWIDDATVLGVVHRLGPGATFDRSDLVAVDAASGVQTPITTVAGGEWLAAPAWHPTRGLAVHLTREDPVTSAPDFAGLVHLDAVAVAAALAGGPPVAAGALTALTSGDDWDSSPDWSPDGSTLAFSTLRPCATLSTGGTPLRQPEIALMDPLDPSTVTLVTDDEAGVYGDGISDDSPAFSPDGTWLAWVRGYEDSWTRIIVQELGDPSTRSELLGGTSWFRHGLDW